MIKPISGQDKKITIKIKIARIKQEKQMNGYMSEQEDIEHTQQTGGAARKQKKARTVKQRTAAKARRDALQMIKLVDTLPHEVKNSGFHYDEESSREVLEESRELGNQTDDEGEYGAQNPVIKQQSIAYRVVANKRKGGKPKIQIRGLALDYDNTQSPFVNAAYLENGRIVEGILDAATRQAASMQPSVRTEQPHKPRKQLRKRKTTAKKQK